MEELMEMVTLSLRRKQGLPVPKSCTAHPDVPCLLQHAALTSSARFDTTRELWTLGTYCRRSTSHNQIIRLVKKIILTRSSSYYRVMRASTASGNSEKFQAKLRAFIETGPAFIDHDDAHSLKLPLSPSRIPMPYIYSTAKTLFPAELRHQSPSLAPARYIASLLKLS
ncbi:hypothetical protein MMC13_005455 [Lambiella insularis]|nr:hypothetical protein [Lambiella insularis]